MVYSPDGTSLASGGEDGLVKVWNVSDATAEPLVFTNSAMVWALGFTPDGSSLAVGDANGRIVVRNLDDTEQVSELQGHSDSITAIQFTSDALTIFSSSYDGRVNQWRAQQPAFPAVATIGVQAGKTWAISTSPMKNHVAVAGKRGFVEVFDLATGECVKQAAEHTTATVDCLQWNADCNGRLGESRDLRQARRRPRERTQARCGKQRASHCVFSRRHQSGCRDGR